MSEVEGVVPETTGEVKRRRPRRRPRQPKADAAVAASATEKVAKRERTPRKVERVPVPASLVGTTSVGKIDILLGRRYRYGFIEIDGGVKAYFPLASFVGEVKPRRGYEVEFTCETDDKGRIFANSVTLTNTGKQQAAEKEAKIAADKAVAGEPKPKAAKIPKAVAKDAAAEVPTEEKAKRSRARARPANAAAAPAEATEVQKKKRSPRRQRDAVESRNVTLSCACQGSSDVKSISIDVSQSIGKLKYAIMTEFGVTGNYSVYHNDVKLSRATLVNLQDNDRVSLQESVGVSA